MTTHRLGATASGPNAYATPAAWNAASASVWSPGDQLVIEGSQTHTGQILIPPSTGRRGARGAVVLRPGAIIETAQNVLAGPWTLVTGATEAGTWAPGTYNSGDIVDHSGQVWRVFGVASTTEEPGTGGDWEQITGLLWSTPMSGGRAWYFAVNTYDNLPREINIDSSDTPENAEPIVNADPPIAIGDFGVRNAGAATKLYIRSNSDPATAFTGLYLATDFALALGGERCEHFIVDQSPTSTIRRCGGAFLGEVPGPQTGDNEDWEIQLLGRIEDCGMAVRFVKSDAVGDYKLNDVRCHVEDVYNVGAQGIGCSGNCNDNFRLSGNVRRFSQHRSIGAFYIGSKPGNTNTGTKYIEDFTARELMRSYMFFRSTTASDRGEGATADNTAYNVVIRRGVIDDMYDDARGAAGHYVNLNSHKGGTVENIAGINGGHNGVQVTANDDTEGGCVALIKNCSFSDVYSHGIAIGLDRADDSIDIQNLAVEFNVNHTSSAPGAVQIPDTPGSGLATITANRIWVNSEGVAVKDNGGHADSATNLEEDTAQQIFLPGTVTPKNQAGKGWRGVGVISYMGSQPFGIQVKHSDDALNQSFDADVNDQTLAFRGRLVALPTAVDQELVEYGSSDNDYVSISITPGGLLRFSISKAGTLRRLQAAAGHTLGANDEILATLSLGPAKAIEGQYLHQGEWYSAVVETAGAVTAPYPIAGDSLLHIMEDWNGVKNSDGNVHVFSVAETSGPQTKAQQTSRARRLAVTGSQAIASGSLTVPNAGWAEIEVAGFRQITMTNVTADMRVAWDQIPSKSRCIYLVEGDEVQLGMPVGTQKVYVLNDNEQDQTLSYSLSAAAPGFIVEDEGFLELAYNQTLPLVSTPLPARALNVRIVLPVETDLYWRRNIDITSVTSGTGGLARFNYVGGDLDLVAGDNVEEQLGFSESTYNVLDATVANVGSGWWELTGVNFVSNQAGKADLFLKAPTPTAYKDVPADVYTNEPIPQGATQVRLQAKPGDSGTAYFNRMRQVT